MVSFESDYIAGAHPEVLKRLIETNGESLPGYGADEYCARAKEKIRAAVGLADAQVEFLCGGTQTNAVVISTMLKDGEGVLCAESGHINTHEAGAIEYTGHKVLTLPQENGRLSPCALEKRLAAFYADENRDHTVFPGMVYISHPTEYGTLYKKSDLEALSGICRRYAVPLYLDGARLGYGLASAGSDLTLTDIARLCDVFYIGGTKVGALCGEAAVFTRNNRPARFLTSLKKRGALPAKGRLLGVQFDALFTDGLYFRICERAVGMAMRLKELFAQRGFGFYIDSPTNQQFVILENRQMEKLSEKVRFCFWEKYGEDRAVVRFATGWSTTERDLGILKEALDGLGT